LPNGRLLEGLTVGKTASRRNPIGHLSRALGIGRNLVLVTHQEDPSIRTEDHHASVSSDLHDVGPRTVGENLPSHDTDGCMLAPSTLWCKGHAIPKFLFMLRDTSWRATYNEVPW